MEKIKFTKSKPIEIDPLVKSVNFKKIEEDIKEFRSLLDLKYSEPILHKFLANHSYFFNGIIRLYGASPLYSKIKLADNFEIDFACFDSGSLGPEWHLIEIESPAHNLLKKTGELTAYANHAIEQVRDWQNWIHENLDFAQKVMPNIQYPRGYVFIGRRSEYTPLAIKRIKRLNYDNRFLAEIHSLDWFISAANSVFNLLEKNKKGDWPLPMTALSHKKLKKGLPKNAQEYINRFFNRSHMLYPEEFLNQRKYFYENVDENNYM